MYKFKAKFLIKHFNNLAFFIHLKLKKQIYKLFYDFSLVFY